MMRVLVMVVSLLGIGGCLRNTQYKCQANADCGVTGTCESTGFCSFPDSMCASGRRYGSLAETGYAEKCVGMTSSEVDAGSGSDAAGPGCPATYTMITGVAAHRYRVITMTNPWDQQRDACAADGANTYLAIPDDMTELQAITTAVGANLRYWVGVDDQQQEDMFVTVRGQAASYLPWDNGEPANGDCVAVDDATGLYDERQCDEDNRAVCECEP